MKDRPAAMFLLVDGLRDSSARSQSLHLRLRPKGFDCVCHAIRLQHYSARKDSTPSFCLGWTPDFPPTDWRHAAFVRHIVRDTFCLLMDLMPKPVRFSARQDELLGIASKVVGDGDLSIRKCRLSSTHQSQAGRFRVDRHGPPGQVCVALGQSCCATPFESDFDVDPSTLFQFQSPAFPAKAIEDLDKSLLESNARYSGHRLIRVALHEFLHSSDTRNGNSKR